MPQYLDRTSYSHTKENLPKLGQQIESYWGQPLTSRSDVQGFTNQYLENVNQELVGEHLSATVVVNRYADKNSAQASINLSGSIISLNPASMVNAANVVGINDPRTYYKQQAGVLGHELGHKIDQTYETRLAGEHPLLVNKWSQDPQKNTGETWHFWNDQPNEQFIQEEKMGLQLNIYRFQDINK